ncbi:UPF0102 protein [Glutamicibacter uratoxydans]|uniref:UPF0102 protein AUR04nite_35040 n=1 Tax=Glutamicibacter uratoxydans TaxID=43667 RepID=A0A4Y4DRK2_GLUUR|nr:YraN family protein [Glutamicibacter uratoxydans]GED07972.1 UPF0102 protein [Glutamicibacter uratoxydans]
MSKTEQQLLGDRGEQAATDFLRQRGYTILDRNWRCKSGELDLIVQDAVGRYIGVEVKTRSSKRYGTGFEAVNSAKYRRLQRLMILWGKSHQTYIAQVRIDVVEVYVLVQGGIVIEHLEDVRS